MTTQPVWYFEDTPTQPGLTEYAHLKHSLKTAWAGLKTLPRYQVHVVYPAPWTVGSDHLEAWMDYYLECISLQQEYPARVTLWPFDVWLLQQGHADVKLVDHTSLQAFLLRNERPELFDLLAALESLACLQAKGQKSARQPLLAMSSRELNDSQMQEVAALLEKAASLEAVMARSVELNSQILDLERRLQAVEQANVQTLAQADSKLLAENAKVKDLQSRLDAASDRNGALERTVKAHEIKLKELEKKSKDLVSENGSVLEQLFKVQEELEVYHLANKDLKAEAKTASGVMRKAVSRLLEQTAKQAAGQQ